jgi:hypothetical protein
MLSGIHWTAALLAGMQGPGKVAVRSWGSPKAAYATKLRSQEEEVLRRGVRKGGDLLVPVFERGYASGPWRQLLPSVKVRLVSRWLTTPHVFDDKGEQKKVWHLGQGQK